MRISVPLAGVMLVFLLRPALSQEWTTFVEPQFGTRLELPSDVFTLHDQHSIKGVGEEFTTRAMVVPHWWSVHSARKATDYGPNMACWFRSDGSAKNGCSQSAGRRVDYRFGRPFRCLDIY
jgi:hypothetical protein